MCIYGGLPFVVMKGIDDVPSLVVDALPSEARHARSEATGFVAANWSKQQLDPAHNIA